MLELDSWLAIAKSAALEAGKYLLINQGKELKILHDADRDIKLQLDIDTENIIKKNISSQSEFSILGEETGFTDDVGEFYWVVDPLDGTSNFLRDIPISCVSNRGEQVDDSSRFCASSRCDVKFLIWEKWRQMLESNTVTNIFWSSSIDAVDLN